MSSTFRDERTRVHSQGFTVNSWGTAESVPRLSPHKALLLTCHPHSIASRTQTEPRALVLVPLGHVSVYCSHDLRTFFRGNTVRTREDMNVTSMHVQENSDYFSPSSLSLMAFFESKTGCFSSWIPSSGSSGDVNCLKGGVNLIACGKWMWQEGALSLWNMH